MIYLGDTIRVVLLLK